MENINMKTEGLEIKNQPIRPAIKMMNVGAVLSFPLKRYRVVCNTVGDLRVELERQFITSRRSAEGFVDVKRTA